MIMDIPYGTTIFGLILLSSSIQVPPTCRQCKALGDRKAPMIHTRKEIQTTMKFAFILLLVVVIISGCSPTTSSSTQVSFPNGTFENSDWSWEFKADGTFLTSGPIGSETGTYQVTGNQITITCECCGDIQGTYLWDFEGSKLSFTAIDDTCANRKDIIDGSTWMKKP